MCTVVRWLAAVWLLGVALPASAVMEPCSNVSLGAPLMLKEGMVSVNFGSKLFVYHPSAGYFAFDDVMPILERSSLLTSVPALASGEDIAGEPLSRWLQRY